MARIAIAAVAAAGLVAGCAANGEGPQIGERAGAGAAIGTVIGAVAGALIARDDTAGALVGAGVGALVGAGIGNSLDEQQRELERNLEGTGATVTNTGEELLVNLPDDVTFDFDSSTIRPEFAASLADVGRTLNAFPDTVIDVVGHTDSTGSQTYNQGLSERRADSVASSLTRAGVRRDRIVAFGQGESQPIATNESELGRAQNRRVELRITPIDAG